MESSRIFVRGLPPKFSDDEVRKHFSKFPVTDVRFFPARRFAFVGYKTEEDAKKAVSYFNKSFIRLCKIFVEIARPFSDQSLPKSRRQQKDEQSVSKHTDYTPLPNENVLKRKRTDDEAEHDPKLKEFLEVMQPPSKTKTWENDVHLPSANTQTVDTVQEVVAPEAESEDEYQEIIRKKPKTSESTKESLVEPQPALTSTKISASNIEEDTVEDELVEQIDGAGGAGERPVVSDTDWLRSRTNRVLDLVEDEEETPSQPIVTDAVPQKENNQEQEPDATSAMKVDEPELSTHDADATDTILGEEDKIRQTGRLYLRNLHFDVTSDDLREHFSGFGDLDEVHVPLKKTDGKGKGFAFLQYKDPEHAVAAFSRNGTIFQGRLLHILSAQSKRDTKLDDFAISKLPLKKQREIQRKANAGGSTFNWNSLYMGADAVISTVAARLGVDKADVLDPTSSDSAVKLAKAETHLIQEVKTYFAQHGVDLEAFKNSSRGEVALLVKNIPHGVTADEIRKLFEEHGTLTRFLFPPNLGMIAIVEFANSAAATSAFRSLAYKKLRENVLYLEKAPKDLFKDGVTAPTASQTMVSDGTATKISATDLLQDVPEPETFGTATLYVRNLNFTTTTQRLSETFSPLEGFRSARVKTKVDPKRGVLSMGFGFVEFSSVETAAAAQKAMNGYSLDSHNLLIKASHQGLDAAEERRREDAAKKAAGTKIIIKNLPFSAQKKDIRNLFSSYGQLRSVRLPKKHDSTSRGFAFADFTTKRDAANAMAALRNTHFLGRRLVLAFAQMETDDPEEELEKMQQKVEAQANKVALQRLTGGNQRKKFNVTGTDDLDET